MLVVMRLTLTGWDQGDIGSFVLRSTFMKLWFEPDDTGGLMPCRGGRGASSFCSGGWLWTWSSHMDGISYPHFCIPKEAGE